MSGDKKIAKKSNLMIENAMTSMAGKYSGIIGDTRELYNFAQYVLTELEIVGEL